MLMHQTVATLLHRCNAAEMALVDPALSVQDPQLTWIRSQAACVLISTYHLSAWYSYQLEKESLGIHLTSHKIQIERISCYRGQANRTIVAYRLRWLPNCMMIPIRYSTEKKEGTSRHTAWPWIYSGPLLAELEPWRLEPKWVPCKRLEGGREMIPIHEGLREWCVVM